VSPRIALIAGPLHDLRSLLHRYARPWRPGNSHCVFRVYARYRRPFLRSGKTLRLV
jgi:hypothetical protein